MTSKLLAALAAAGLFVATAIPAYAQSGPLSPSEGQGGSTDAPASLTEGDVDPSDPWGDLEIDMSGPLSSDMESAQLAELKARCDVILANTDRYDATYVTFCQTNASAMSQ